MGRITALLGLVIQVGFFAGSVDALPQSKNQQKCINQLNEDAIKVAAAQGRANLRCIDYAAKGKVALLGAADARACLTRALRERVDRRTVKTVATAEKFCTEIADVPEFGVPAGSAAEANGLAVAANFAATSLEFTLVEDLLGPSINPAIIACADDRSGCVCQSKTARRVDQLTSTRLKEYRKCKTRALRAGDSPFPAGAVSAEELGGCVDDDGVAGSIADDAKGKIAKAVARLGAEIASHCDPGEVVSPVPFPGYCVGLAGNALADCLDQRVACRVCLLANAADGLSVDCDAFDDDLSNSSCPATAIQQETIDIASGAMPAETPGTPGATFTNQKLEDHFGPGIDLNKARYTRYHWVDAPTPDAILILIPGFEGGAGDFKILAENLLVRSRVVNEQIVEVWGYDRRTNQLEDTEGLEISEAALDPLIGLDWLFGDDLGFTLHPALAAGPGRRAIFYNTSDDVPFLANWTALMFSRDIDAVVGAALATVGNGNVFLGGHSAGTGFTARYASTDFDLTGLGPVEAGYAKVRGLVLLEGGGGSSTGSPPSADTLDRIEAKFDGGLFGAVRDQAPRCVDGTTPCTTATEAVDCAAFSNDKCTQPTGAYSVFAGLLNPQILAAVEPSAIQGATDPDGGQIILQIDFGSGTAVGTVPELATLGILPQATVFGGIGSFIDDDGFIAGLASFVATSVGDLAAVVGGLQTWQDIGEGTLPAAALPNHGPPPTTLPAPLWGQEKEVTDFSRMLKTFYVGGTNFTDWYYPSAGPSVTSGLPGLDSSALSADPPAGRGRRDIENLTQAANINVPVIGFGGSNGGARVPASFMGFAGTIAICSTATCDGVTPRIVDAMLPNPAFPTYGDAVGGFEAYISEGFAHVDVLTAEDNADNNVLAPLANFIQRHSQ